MLVTPTINSVHGRIRSITGTDPAAGAEISETIPDRRRWKLQGLIFTLVTDSTIATRSISIVIDDGTTPLYQRPFLATQAASLTYIYSFYNWTDFETQIDSRVFIPLPTFTLSSGFRIRTTTTDLQAGDNFSAPQLLAEEWLDP